MNFPAPALYCGKCPIERRGQRSALLVKIHGACVRLKGAGHLFTQTRHAWS